MPDPAADIAERAMKLASSFLEGASAEIAEMAAGDLNVLFKASQIVRSHASEGTNHSAEHLAFSLISAAHSDLRSGGSPGA